MRILGAGDMIFGGRKLRERFDPRVLELLDGADLVFANAEFTIPRPSTPAYPEGYTLGTHRWAAAELRSLGIELVSGANNHTGDYGHLGVLDTIDAFAAEGIELAGVGRSLAEARSATYADSPHGRVGLVATSTTGADGFRAADAGRKVAARPGLNPLRWSARYELTDEQFEQVLAIQRALGIDATHRETDRIEIRENLDPDRTSFGGASLRRAEQARVRFDVHRQDLEEICAAIEDATATADVVLVSMHAHEGEDEGWYSEQPAEFLVEAAHAMVEAGASAVFGHGPHMLRGIEVHRGAPIFYSLNGLTFDLETGPLMPAEMLEKYGHPTTAFPSRLHLGRRYGADGQPVGFSSEARFSDGLLAELEFAEGRLPTAIRLHPIDMRLGADTLGERGMPRLAAGEDATRILGDVLRMSKPFGTEIAVRGDIGTID
ncbi:CapA family protein [Gulosibacter sp. 10]|uniref:CapA family protein n=1 Tax=Gulosibacter sp. 10 TaxID=1255570 RepID=UPI00097F545F|nr:CapA family protein [Gulosibacter sp. 10]SJM59537.1 Putative enzyme of poly-gamma-glutamate biosynthesis (capsule formation) [Gulosibacter sp. 10]